MVRQQFAKLRPSNWSCGFDPHTLRHEKDPVRKDGSFSFFEEVLLLLLRPFLHLRLPLSRGGFGSGFFVPNEFNRLVTARVGATFAGVMLRETRVEVRRNADVQTLVGAAQDVGVPRRHASALRAHHSQQRVLDLRQRQPTARTVQVTAVRHDGTFR